MQSNDQTNTLTSATSLRADLLQLKAERAMFAAIDSQDAVAELSEIDLEITATHAAYVGTAVTEIAVLRAELSGRLEG